MNRQATMKISSLLVKQLSSTSRLFSTSSSFFNVADEISRVSSTQRSFGMMKTPLIRARKWSNVAEKEDDKPRTLPSSAAGKSDGENDKTIVSYWGVAPPKLSKEDGSPWKWNSFRPWETYKADTTIDVKKHHSPITFMDKFAYWTVQVVKYPTYLYFQKRHMCHAMLLETVAAVPGMVGGMLLHCKSLRKFQHSNGWIKALLEEAENERMHLMTFLEISKPSWHEKTLVFIVQGLFFNAYFIAYVLSPKLAHRIVGYLEEEAVNSYTDFLNDLEKGVVENSKAPAIAIDYWRLPIDSTLKDVVTVIRADEAHHRDLNHFASDIQFQGHELKDYPAPLGYH